MADLLHCDYWPDPGMFTANDRAAGRDYVLLLVHGKPIQSSRSRAMRTLQPDRGGWRQVLHLDPEVVKASSIRLNGV